MKIDSSKKDVLKTFESFGFFVVRENEHIMLKNAEQGKNVCLPNHKKIKGSTLSRELTKAGINKKEFFSRY